MNSRRKQADRRGNALVELVVSLPILFVLTFGGVEACNLNHLQGCATQTSYQGALRGITSGSTEADIRNLMEAMLAARNIQNATITIEGANGASFDSLEPGDRFVVSTQIPADDNLPLLSMVCSLTDLRADRYAERN